MGGILFMNENARIVGNQNYFMGRTKQTEHQYEKQADGLTLWHVRKQMS